jgi:hypothetical protein
VPAVPSCLLEPIWVEFHALLNEARGGEPPAFDPGHPWGCHRRRIPDRVVFEHVIDALVHGSGYERIASEGCSDRTIRRRVKVWARLGLTERLHAVGLAAYDLIIGMDLSDVSVDGCITKAPCRGEKQLAISVSTTHRRPFACSSMSTCRASCAERRGRNPKEQSRMSASKTGSNTIFSAACTTRRLIQKPLFDLVTWRRSMPSIHSVHRS